MRLVLVEHELVVGEIVLEEVERVLAKKLRMPREIVAGDIALLRECHVQPTARAPKGSPIRDPDDARILRCLTNRSPVKSSVSDTLWVRQPLQLKSLFA
jgi:hypothetical protein